jgi:hypothetical protein
MNAFLKMEDFDNQKQRKPEPSELVEESVLKIQRIGLPATASSGSFQTTFCCILWKHICGERKGKTGTRFP